MQWGKVGLLLIMLCSGALGWGPVSHGSFNCGALKLDVKDCLYSKPSLAVGSAFPDAFYFGNFNISGTECQNLGYVHDLVFAGHLLNFALNFSTLTDFSPIDFARGFAGHIVGDMVGFSPSGGILCGNDTCTPYGQIWMPEWGYMSAIDAYFFIMFDLAADKLHLPDESEFTEAWSFFSQATQKYHEVKASFMPLSSQQIAKCASFWSNNMKYDYSRGEMYATNNALLFLMNEIKFFAPHPEVDISSYLTAQAECSSVAVKEYMEFIAEYSPEEAATKIATYVESLYAANKCGL